jgi:hypothetical protein
MAAKATVKATTRQRSQDVELAMVEGGDGAGVIGLVAIETRAVRSFRSIPTLRTPPGVRHRARSALASHRLLLPVLAE